MYINNQVLVLLYGIITCNTVKLQTNKNWRMFLCTFLIMKKKISVWNFFLLIMRLLVTMIFYSYNLILTQT